MEDLLYVGTGDLDKGLCCSPRCCMSPNPSVPSSRSRNGCRGWSRVGNTLEDRKAHVPKVLRLYEAMRKRRTTTNVQGAIENRQLFQIADEGEVEIRNKELLDADLTDINKKCRWGHADLSYQKQLMGFDTIKDAREQFENWIRNVQ
jgi:hypothetical protein